MTLLKETNYIDVIMFKRFSLFNVCVITENSKNFVIFVNRKWLKVISSVKAKNKTFSKKKYKFLKPFFKLFLNIYIPALVTSFLLYINLIYKVWVYLINERQQIDSRFQGLKKGIPWNKHIAGSMSASRKLQLQLGQLGRVA